MGALESLFDMGQVVLHSLSVEMVNDKTLTARSCAFYLHNTILNI